MRVLSVKERCVADEIRYIESMSADLAKMAHKLNNPFLAYLLTMVSLEAREQAAKALVSE